MEHIILITLCLRIRCLKTHLFSYWSFRQFLDVETSPDPSMKFFKLRRNHQVVRLSKPGRIAAIRGQQQWGVLKTGNHWVQFIPICWDRESEDVWTKNRCIYDLYVIYIYIWSDKIRTLWGVVLPFLVYLGKSSIWIRIGSYKYCYEL